MARQVYQQPLVSLQEAFNVWCAIATPQSRCRLPNHDIRLYQGPKLSDDMAAYAPLGGDLDFDGYMSRLHALTGERSWGFCLSDPQVASGTLFRGLATFIGELCQWTNTWDHRVGADLFYLHRHKGLFALHKDSQDVVTFVLHGRRRYLLWPFEYFKGRFGVTESDRLRRRNLGRVPGIDRYDGDAIVLEVQAGDMVYWPADWWHRGEADERETALTVGLGIFRDSNASRHLWTASGPFADLLQSYLACDVSGGEAFLAAYRNAISRLMTDAPSREALDRVLLRSITSAGLVNVPVELSDGATLDDNAVIRLVAPRAVAWTTSGQHALVFAAGREIPVSTGVEIESLKLIADAQPHALADIVRVAMRSAPSEPRDVIVARVGALLTTLAACHALEREELPEHVGPHERTVTSNST